MVGNAVVENPTRAADLQSISARFNTNLGLGHGQARQELLDRNLILFRRLIKTFAVAVARQDD